jgi:polyribonucleotide nucleotidyltransferase
MNVVEESISIGDKKLTFQIGKLAKAADVSIFGQLGDTCVLVTVVMGPENPKLDYFPLAVDYVEKLYAGGRIKGSRWVKREGRPSDDAILIGRIIDRSIRPLFPKGFKNNVQIIITLLSVDGINSPEIVSAITTSSALHLSAIPWQGPISTIRVGYVKNNGQNKGTFIVNPDEQSQRFSQLDLIVSSTSDKVVMMETKAEIISESIIIEAIEKAKEENKKIIAFIENLRKKINKPKISVKKDSEDTELINILQKEYSDQLEKNIGQNLGEKENEEEISALVNTIYEDYQEKFDKQKIYKTITQFIYQKIREKILKEKKRADGRAPGEIRDLHIETSLLPRTHGSALFQRGQTQVLSIATLGSPTLEQLIESPEGEEAKRYIHHYYMPPYSVGEVKRLMFPSRREIGHGALAEKAIEPVLPSEEKFPYAIRVVSEVLSSNGSTSMASACGSSLALMDAGVPIKSTVAGISIGMVSKNDQEYILLTDICGLEDFAGDMDFKIAGTDQGITAIQLDVKNKGLTNKMIKEALEQARIARIFILKKMNQIMATPRKELSKYAPKVVILTPPQDKIGEIIGPGGKNIRQIIAKTQTEIDISDDGKVSISGLDHRLVDEAVNLIQNAYRKVMVGEIFEGMVKRILPFGVIVEFLPGKEGLIHVSKLGSGFVRDPHQIVRIGQKVKVRVIQIDSQGRTNLAKI